MKTLVLIIHNSKPTVPAKAKEILNILFLFLSHSPLPRLSIIEVVFFFLLIIK